MPVSCCDSDVHRQIITANALQVDTSTNYLDIFLYQEPKGSPKALKSEITSSILSRSLSCERWGETTTPAGLINTS